MNRNFLRNGRPFLVVTLLFSFMSMAQAIIFTPSAWPKGYETCNWKGVYVGAQKGGDGNLAAAFDGIYGTGNGKIGSAGLFPLTVDLMFPTPQVLTKYQFHTVDWDDGAKARSPKEWRIEASNDAQEWNELDYHDDGATYFTKKYQQVDFAFENKQAYKYYRISFLSCISGTLFGLQEIVFPEYTPSAPLFLDPKVDLTIGSKDNWCYLEKELIRATTTTIKAISAVYSDNSLTELGVVYSTSNSRPALDGATKVVGSYTVSPLFSTEITGLTPNTTYYVRPFATNAQGTSYGEVFAVTTASVDASTISLGEPAIDSDRAIMTVKIPVEFTGTITERGVVWNSTEAPNVDYDKKYIATQASTGEFRAIVHGLQPRECYHVRPYVKADGVVHYGGESTFYSLPLAQFKWHEGAVVTSGLTRDMYHWKNFIDHAFDNKTNTRFTGLTQTSLLFTFDKSHKLNNYKMGNADDATRYPKSWSIMASNDKSNWDVLHTMNGYTWSDKLTTADFSFTNTKYYTYYKLEVTENSGHYASVDITEFNFTDYPNPDTGTSVDTSVEAQSVRSYVDANNRVVVSSAKSEPLQVVIYNSLGQAVYRTLANESSNVLNASLTSGVYLIQVNTPSVGTVINKVVVR